MEMNKEIIREQEDRNQGIWIELYQGIAVILLVIGHAGRFQRYIYPFHAAAFFFVAGYAQGQEKRNTLRTVWDEFYTLLLPYSFVFLFLLLCCEVLNRMGLYRYFFPEYSLYYGLSSSVNQFFIHGKCLVWWLDAGWICLSFFAVQVLHSVFSALSGKDTRIYFILTVLMYFTGYYLVREGYFFRVGWINHDLVCIGFGFFGAGSLFRQMGILERWKAPKKGVQKVKWAVVFVGSAAVMYYFTRVVPSSVCYPERSFNQPFPDFIMGISGCILLWFLTVFLEKLPYIKSVFLCIGRNWMGIIFFHLQFFSVTFGILYFFHRIPLDAVRQLYPDGEIGRIWWWLFVLVGIVMSIAEWKLLTSITGIRFFLGKKKNLWDGCYDWIREKWACTVGLGAVFHDL